MNSFYAITIQAFMITSETNSLSPHIKLKDKKHRRITFFKKWCGFYAVTTRAMKMTSPQYEGRCIAQDD